MYGGHHTERALVTHAAEKKHLFEHIVACQHENVPCLQAISLLTNLAIFANDFSQNSQFRMPEGMPSVEVRARVIGILENGTTENQAAMRAGVQRATVFRIKKNPKPGRPMSTMADQERFVRLTALRLSNLLPTLDGLYEWQSTQVLYGTD